jgi:hypothetical protein
VKKPGIVQVPILSDGADPVGRIKINHKHLEQLALESVLDTWIPESVRFYACEDGPVLVIWGSHNGRLAIRGITIDVSKLNADSEFRIAWEKYRATELTVAAVHRDVLGTLRQPSN